MKKIILHVGADKCGSSSIQTYLTKNPTPESLGNPNLQYSCLLKNGIIGPKGILHRSKSSVVGYVNSADISELQFMNAVTRNAIPQFVNEGEVGHIFSCEGWLRSLSYRKNTQFLLNLLNSPSSKNVVEMYAFVRPPVKWINSAWWQWGAWTKGINFDTWLQNAIRGSSWYNFLSGYFQEECLDCVRIMPMIGNVVEQFCESINIKYTKSQYSQSNVSMPMEAICLMWKHRRHRPAPHFAKDEFLLARALASSNSMYESTPWVLKPEHIEKIISSTKDVNLQLLGLMSESDRSKVLADPSWWDPSFYENRNVVAPFNPGSISTDQALQMASDLLVFVNEAVDILIANSLLDKLLLKEKPNQGNLNNS
jgi:hypothetical protein